MVSNGKQPITWPDILNELYGNAIIVELPTQSSSLLHSILYRFNQHWFPHSLYIPNGDLKTLSNLTSKQFTEARKTLLEKVNTKVREEYEFIDDEADFLTYEPSGSSLYSGRYRLNLQPMIRRLASVPRPSRTRPAPVPGLSGGSPEQTFRDCGTSEVVEKGDHNNTTQFPIQSNLNENINYNTNQNNDVIDVLDLKEDEIIEMLHKEITSKLSQMGMRTSAIDKLVKDYSWDHIVETYNVVNGKENVNNYVGYFVKTLENVANDRCVVAM